MTSKKGGIIMMKKIFNLKKKTTPTAREIYNENKQNYFMFRCY